MKIKSLLLFSLFLFIGTLSIGQIVNGSFEDTGTCFPQNGSIGTAFEDGCLGPSWNCYASTPSVAIEGLNGNPPAFDGTQYATVALFNGQSQREAFFFSEFDITTHQVFEFSMAVRSRSQSIGFKVIAVDTEFLTPSCDDSPFIFNEPPASVSMEITSGVVDEVDGWQVITVDGITFDPSIFSGTTTNLLFFPVDAGSPITNEALFIDQVSFGEGSSCQFNPYFFQELCRVGDELEITMVSSGEGPFHNWRVWLVDEGEDCNPLNEQNAELVFEQTNTNPNGTVTFIFPDLTFEDLVGRCLIIRHGMWSANCMWRQFHRTVIIPDIPAVDPFFSSTSTPNGPNSRVWFYNAIGQNTLPVANSWTAERSNSINGPWTPWPITSGANTPNFAVLQQNNRFFRICHEVSSTLDGVCSRSTQCIIILPLNEGMFLIANDDGRVIGEESTNENEDETEDGGSGRNSNRSAMGDLSNLDHEVILFPNPARDHFKLSNNTEYDVQVEVYNTNGQLMMSNQINASSQRSFDTNSLTSGIYFIQVKDMETGSFIKTEKLSIVK